MNDSIILMADSYKYSQFNQYPPNTKYIYSYIESRGGEWDKTVFFGLQAFIKKYLTKPITQEEIDYAEEVILAHGLPFYREGWEYILNEHNGYLPIEIRSVDEGTIVPTNNVLVDVVNTDPVCYWLTSFLETALLQAVWYPTTVATNSYESKKIIHKALVESGTPEAIDFKLHDFGERGVSSMESAAIGGAAHLVNFKGTDTVRALLYCREYYDCDMAGFSIPAMEHSTVTSWGREGEVDSYRNMIKQNAHADGLFAAVSDSYDIFKACEMWGTVLKDDVINSGATLVVRPDSGHPATIVLECLKILDKNFGHIVNDKGYKVLNHVRVIQGDGINHQSIQEIIDTFHAAGYSADNVTFGQGGALLQMVNRDTLKWAMKCSAAYIDDKWVDVQKDPITDNGKRSKKGRLKLQRILMEVKPSGYYDYHYTTVSSNETDFNNGCNILQERFVDGMLMNLTTLDEIRERANKEFIC